MLLLVAACKAALNRDAMQINGLLFIFEKVLCFLGRMFGQDVEVVIAFEVSAIFRWVAVAEDRFINFKMRLFKNIVGLAQVIQ